MIGGKIYKLKETDSTNSYLNRSIKTDMVPEGTVVIASEQSSGRGQMTNSWESEPGKNILMSTLLCPNFIEASEQFLISKIVSVSVAEYVRGIIGGDRVKIKWPNDIYIDDFKVAGILIENNLRGANISTSVVGVGLNVNQKTFSENIPNPTSLKLVTKETFDIDEVLYGVLEKFNYWYAKLKARKFDEINEQYLKMMYRFNISSKYSDKDGEFYGKITGVKKYGMLCIIDDLGKEKIYNFKEVEFLF